jgi:hypothetical protein
MDLRGLFLGALAALTATTTVLAAEAAKRPAPPPKVCIGNDCVTPPVATTTAIKFHPGFYPYFNYSGGVSLSKLSMDATLIASLQPDDNVQGIAIAVMWRNIDKGTTAPSYDWSIIDAYLKAVKGSNKRLWVRVQDAAFGVGSSVAKGNRMVPDWLINKYGIENVQLNYMITPNGVAAKRYNPVVTAAYIAMYQAMAARYDSDPNFEGVTMFEETAYAADTSGSSVTAATPGADYTPSGMLDQLYALMAGLRDPQKGFKTSNVQLGTNYLFKASDSAAAWTDVYNHIVQYKMMIGGPDSFIGDWVYPMGVAAGIAAQAAGPGTTRTNTQYRRAIVADEVYRGWYKGSTDWRGKILFGPDVELTDVGGYITKNMNPIPTMADIWQVRGPTLDNSHYMFFDIDWQPSGNYGTAAQQWPAQYAWVKKAGKTNQNYPY